MEKASDAVYGCRMDMQGRSKQTGLNVLSTPSGASWRQCEDLDLELEKETGLKTILERLDKQWQYDEKIEMPEAFAKYVYKTS